MLYLALICIAIDHRSIMLLKGALMTSKRLPDDEQLSPLSIRIPLSLREQIEQSARSNRRSLNQEVIL
jgi:hypothetical protein